MAQRPDYSALLAEADAALAASQAIRTQSTATDYSALLKEADDALASLSAPAPTAVTALITPPSAVSPSLPPMRPMASHAPAAGPLPVTPRTADSTARPGMAPSLVEQPQPARGDIALPYQVPGRGDIRLPTPVEEDPRQAQFGPTNEEIAALGMRPMVNLEGAPAPRGATPVERQAIQQSAPRQPQARIAPQPAPSAQLPTETTVLEEATEHLAGQAVPTLGSPQRFAEGLTQGVGGIASGIGGTIEWGAGAPGTATHPAAALAQQTGGALQAAGEWLVKAGQPNDPQTVQRVTRDFLEDPSALTDPQWWAFNVGSGVGSQVAFLAPMLGTGAVVGQIGALAAKVPKLVKAIEIVGGVGAGTVVESLVEAGLAYKDAIAAGAPVEKASEAAAYVAQENLKMLAATNVAGYALPGIANAGVVRRILTAFLAEGAQEGYQAITSGTAQQQFVDPSVNPWEGAATEALIGGVVGGGTGAVLGQPAQTQSQAEPEVTVDEVIEIVGQMTPEERAAFNIPQTWREELEASRPESQPAAGLEPAGEAAVTPQTTEDLIAQIDAALAATTESVQPVQPVQPPDAVLAEADAALAEFAPVDEAAYVGPDRRGVERTANPVQDALYTRIREKLARGEQLGSEELRAVGEQQSQLESTREQAVKGATPVEGRQAADVLGKLDRVEGTTRQAISQLEAIEKAAMSGIPTGDLIRYLKATDPRDESRLRLIATELRRRNVNAEQVAGNESLRPENEVEAVSMRDVARMSADVAEGVRFGGAKTVKGATPVELSFNERDATPEAVLADADAALAETGTVHKFSSTQLNLPPETASGIAALASRIPDEDLAADGRETEPHVTVKYGLDTADPSDVARLLEGEGPITVRLGKTSHFADVEDGTADAVKVDIVDSPELHRLHEKIGAALKNEDTHPDYKPHATVAYVKPGLGKNYDGDASLEGQTITIDRLAFSGKDGRITEIPLTGAAAKATPSTKPVAEMSNEELAAEILAEYEAEQRTAGLPTAEAPEQEPQAGHPLPKGHAYVGDRLDGTPLYADAKGVRYFLEGNAKSTESVRMVVQRGGMTFGTDRTLVNREYLTAEEVAALTPKAPDLPVSPKKPKTPQVEAPTAYVVPTFVTQQQTKPQTPVEKPPHVSTLKVGERVTVDEGSGTVHAFDGATRNVKIALEPDGRLSNWIPVDRVSVATVKEATPVEPKKVRASDIIAEPTLEGKRALLDQQRADLHTKKAANKAKRDEIAKRMAARHRTTVTSGLDPQDVADMVGIVRTYIDDGTVEFQKAWLTFKAEYPKLAAMVERPFEIAWRRLTNEDRKVADIAAPASTPSKTTTVISDPEQRVRRLFAVFSAMVAEDKLPKDPRELRKIAESFVGGDATTYTDEITDAIEAALTKGTAELVTDGSVSLLSQVQAALADEAKLPRAHRSLEKTKLQQFSTPLPIAIAAQYAARPTTSDVILEPTAGTGHLISALDPTKHGGGGILAHELSPRRATLLKALGFHVTEGDYLKALDLKERADVIITNPPWGKYTTGKYGAPVGLRFTPGDVAERFIAKNIRDLKPGGRLVAVMPTTMLGVGGVPFRNYLEQAGTIRAIIQSPPGAYRTRSTDVESVLLVFDKQTGLAENRALQTPQTWEAYTEAVSRIPAREAKTDVSSVRSDRPAVKPAEGRPQRPAPAAADAGGRGSGQAAGRPERPGPAPESGTAAVPPGRHARVVADQPGSERGELDAARTPGRVAPADAGDPTRGLSGDNLAAYRDAGSSPHFAPYRLRTPLEGQRHPKLVVEARSLAGVTYPPITIAFSPRSTRIVKEGRLSVEQAEQALAAVQANVVHHYGYLAADNVGVGKSREIALTIVELMERAKKDGRDLRLLVTTKSADNIKDLIDGELLSSVLAGEAPGFEIVRVPDLKSASSRYKQGPRESLPQFEHAIYVVDSYNLAAYRDGLMEVGLQGVVGDEAHRFRNADAAVGATWQTLHAQIMRDVPRPHQAFAYFTATPAQSVFDYQYLYGLRLWPIDGFREWVNVVTGQASEEAAARVREHAEVGGVDLDAVVENNSGNVVGGDAEDVGGGRDSGADDIFSSRLTPAEAEQIPREWKMLGRFSSRDLWRAGTEFQVHQAELPDEARDRYDQFAQLARDIIDAARKFGLLDKSGRSSRYGVTAQLQFAAKRLQAQPAIEEAIRIAQREVRAGHQAVISLINVSEMNPTEGNIAAAINQINTRVVEKTDDGFVDGGEIPEALIAQAELREQAEALGVLDNPLDLVADAFGPEKVAMIVGGTGAQRQVHVREFQEGKRQVAVLSAAGTTGINLDHRTLTEKGAKGRRVFIDVQYEWSATEAIQRYGRVDRASSISPPRIIALTFGAASEKKFLATIANRMSSLGALSKGGAESTGAGALEEFEITGIDALMAARDAWAALPEEDRALWKGARFRDPNHPGRPANITSANMREINLALLWLPMDKATVFWESFIQRRDEIRSRMGYADEARTRALRGEVQRTVELSPTLTIYQVKNEAGHRFGIVSGVVMEQMPKLRHFLPEQGRRYVTFSAGDQVISGLEIPVTRLRALAKTYEKSLQAEKLDTPEAVEAALRAGDKVPVKHPGWTLRMRQDGVIAIDGAKMADRELLLKHGGGYRPVGNIWYAADLAKFLERWPALQEDESATAVADDPEDDDGGAVSAMPRTPSVAPPPSAPAQEVRRDAEAHVTDRPVDPLRPSQGSPRTGAPRRMAEDLSAVGVVSKRARVSVPDIIHSLADAVAATGKQIGLRVGRVRGQMMGTWNSHTHVARTRAAHDVPTATHEVAHALQTLLMGRVKGTPWVRPLASVAMQRELVGLGRTLYGDRRPVGGYKSEGWAEFVRTWVTESDLHGQPVDVTTLAPATARWFGETFARDYPEVYRALERTRDLTRQWRRQGARARAEASVEDPASIASRAGRAVKSLRRFVSMEKLVEMAQPLYELARAAEAVKGRPLKPSRDPFFTISALRMTHDSRTRYMVEHGMIDLAGNRVGPPLNEIRSLVKGQRAEFTLYLWARRAMALWDDPRGPRHPGLSREDAEQILRELDSPAFQLAASKVYAWNNGVLNYAAQASPTFARVVDAVRERDPGDYVPLQRVFEDLDDLWSRSAGSGRPSQSSPVKRLTGSGRRIKDIFPTMIAQASHTLRQAHTRLVLDQVIRLAGLPGMGHLIEEVAPDQRPVVATTVGELLDRLQRETRGALPVDTAAIDDDVLGTAVTFFAPLERPKGRDPIIPIYDQGRVRWFHVDGPLFDTLSTLDVYRLPDVAGLPIAEWLLGKPAAMFRAGTTGLRASFGLIWNPLKDVQTFMVNTQSRRAAPVLFAKWMHAWFDMALSRVAVRNSAYVDAWLRLGAEMAQPLAQDIDHTRRTARQLFEGRVVRTLDPRNWFDFYRDIIQFPEGAPRVAELELVAERVGWKPGEPMTLDQSLQLLLASKQVTTDFTAAGELARIVNRMVPFHNAAIQGPRANLRAARRSPALFAWRGLSIAAATLLLWWDQKDEEWYTKMNYRDRYLHWWFPVTIDGRDELVRIPRAFEIGMVFAAMPEMLMDAWYRQEPQQVKEWFQTFTEVSVPGIEPVLLRVAREQWQNRQWPDRKIVSMSVERKPPAEQFYEYTSRVAIFLGEKFNLSPLRIEHAIRGTLGPVSTDLITLLSPSSVQGREGEPADWALVGRLFQRGGTIGTESKPIRDLYDLAEKVQIASQSDRQPETPAGRQQRLQLADAASAVSALLTARRYLALVDEQRVYTAEASKIAQEAVTLHTRGFLDRDLFAGRRRSAEDLRDVVRVLRRSPLPVPERPARR